MLILGCAPEEPWNLTQPTFPADAPPEHWFEEVELGVATGEANGLSLADLNQDGRLDIALARREGGLVIYEQGASAGALQFNPVWEFDPDPESADNRVVGIAAVDVVGDSAPDLLAATIQGLRIWRGSLHSTPQVQPELAPDPLGPAKGVQLADIDNDGLADVYVLNYAPQLQGYSEDAGRNRLWLNEAGVLTRREAMSNLEDAGASWAAATGDLDADGRFEVLVANDAFVLDTGADGGNTRLALESDESLMPDAVYRDAGRDPHNGYPKYEFVPGDFVAKRSSMGLLVGDFEGEGQVSVYQSDYGANKLFSVEAGVALETRSHPELEAAWRDDGVCGGKVDPVHCLLVSWASVLADFDLDSWADLVVLNAATLPGVDPAQPVATWQGTAQGFESAGSSLGWVPGRGLCAVDLDADGDLDLLLANREPGRPELRYFQNRARVTTPPLSVSLRATQSNPGALGARVEVTRASGRVETRVLGASGRVHSWCPTPLVFAASDDPFEKVRVVWPSGVQQRVADPPQSGPLEMVEPRVLRLSSRVVASETERVSVTLFPIDLATGMADPTLTLTLECLGCEWTHAPRSDRNGALTGEFIVSPAESSALILARVGSRLLSLAPRVWKR